ncbi:MAG: CBM9 family sugar-binding protein [Granulosicoccus sp.]|nr:CBM9 family sugar-binding protein [Granulosicoccus sp.]
MFSQLIKQSHYLLLATGVLAGCSGDSPNTVILAEGPELDVQAPSFLTEGFLDTSNLRPIVQISNGGGLVSMNPNPDGSSWSGTINLPPSNAYRMTVTWVENYNGGELFLASLSADLTVNSDGTAQQSNITAYDSEQFDDDQDNISNLQERRQGSDPYTPATGTAAADGAVANPGNPPPTQTTTPAETDPQMTPGAATDPATETDTVPEDPAGGDDQPNGDEVAADVIVPRVNASDAPIIDGLGVTLNTNEQLGGEWAAAVQVDNSGETLFIDSLMIDKNTDESDGSPFRRWAAMHDGTYLYVLVIVEDDGDRVRDSGSNIFNDDSLELFIDGDNDKETSYDDDDFHRHFPMVQITDDNAATSTGDDAAGPNSTGARLILDYASGPGNGPQGLQNPQRAQDVYELRIELDSADIDLDEAFGFELQINDDDIADNDDGDERDAKWGWKHPSRGNQDVDFTWMNPSYMGTLKLE